MSSATPTVIAGKYEVLGRLGQGGQASVYKVRHLGLGEIRALKLLPDHGADTTESVARFRREGRALARLRHPHIVQVFDLGRAGDQYYLEMEYVDGPNLARYVKMHGRPPLRDALEIVRQVASALAYAHGQPYEDASGNRQAGLVHRDVKPSNVLLREALPLHAMLADFGLVKLEDTLGHTAIGTMLGTYRYSAPEQLGLKREGERVPVDVRADVFALGLVLYELLEGRQFHAGRQPDEILARVVYDADALAPTFTAPVPAAARDLVARMIRRWPEERPENMAEVLRALAALIVEAECEDDSTVVVTPPAARVPPPPPPEAPPRRAHPPREEPSPRAIAAPAARPPQWPRAALLAGAAIVVAAGAWLLRGGRSADEAVVAPAPRVVAAPPTTLGAPPSLAPPEPTPATSPPPTVPPAAQPAAALVPVPPPPVTTTTLAPEPARIVSQRPVGGRPITVAEGDGVDFSVQATGRGLRYRWLLDGEEVGTKPGWRFVAPAAQAARTPFRVEAQVTGEDGPTERPAVWTGEVTWKPPDLRKPVPADAKVRVPAGDDQSFRIQATAPRSAGDVRFEWSVDGKPALRGSEPEFTLQTEEPGTHRVEVAAVDGRGAWTTHRWTVEVVAPSRTPPPTVPAVAAVSPTTMAPPPTMPPTTVRTSPPTTLPPAPPTTLPAVRPRADAGTPISDEEMAAWVERLRRAWATKDVAALRALGEVSASEEKGFKRKIANNPDYAVQLWNVSIMIDPRGADVTFDRRDTDHGKVIQQPAKTVRLERGPGGLVVVR
jgi:eukaryotic-like serine/threonine-protein kinase